MKNKTKSAISILLAASITILNVLPAFATHVKVGQKVMLNTNGYVNERPMVTWEEIEKIMSEETEKYGSDGVKIRDNAGNTITDTRTPDANLDSILNKMTGGKASVVLTKEEYEALLKEQTGKAWEEFLKKKSNAKTQAIKGNAETAKKIKDMVEAAAKGKVKVKKSGGKSSGNTPNTDPQGDNNTYKPTNGVTLPSDATIESVANAISAAIHAITDYGIDENGDMYLNDAARDFSINQQLAAGDYTFGNMYKTMNADESPNTSENDKIYIDDSKDGLDAYYGICERCGYKFGFTFSKCTCRYKKYIDGSINNYYEKNNGNTDFVPHNHRFWHNEEVKSNGTKALKKATVETDAEGKAHIGKDVTDNSVDYGVGAGGWNDAQPSYKNEIGCPVCHKTIDWETSLNNRKNPDLNIMTSTSGMYYHESCFNKAFPPSSQGSNVVESGTQLQNLEPVDKRQQIITSYNANATVQFDPRLIPNLESEEKLWQEHSEFVEDYVKDGGLDQKTINGFREDIRKESESIKTTWESESKEIAENGRLREETAIKNMKAKAESDFNEAITTARNSGNEELAKKLEAQKETYPEKIAELESVLNQAKNNKNAQSSIMNEYLRSRKADNESIIYDRANDPQLSQVEIESIAKENGGRNKTAYTLARESEVEDALSKAVNDFVKNNPGSADWLNLDIAKRDSAPDEFYQSKEYKDFLRTRTAVTAKYDAKADFLDTEYKVNGNIGREMQFGNELYEDTRKELQDVYLKYHPEMRQTDADGKDITHLEVDEIHSLASGEIDNNPDLAKELSDVYKNAGIDEADTAVYDMQILEATRSVMKELSDGIYETMLEDVNTNDYALEYIDDMNAYENNVNATTMVGGENVKISPFLNIRVIDTSTKGSMNIFDMAKAMLDGLDAFKKALKEGGLTESEIQAILDEMNNKDPYDDNVGGQSERNSLAGAAGEFATSPEYQTVESEVFSERDKTWQEILDELLERLKKEFGYTYDENGNLIFTDETLKELIEAGLLDENSTLQDVMDKILDYIASFSSIEDYVKFDLVSRTELGERHSLGEPRDVFDGIDVQITDNSNGALVFQQTYLNVRQSAYWCPFKPGVYTATSTAYWWKVDIGYVEQKEIIDVKQGGETICQIEVNTNRNDMSGYNHSEKTHAVFATDTIYVDPATYAIDVKDYPDVEQIF